MDIFRRSDVYAHCEDPEFAGSEKDTNSAEACRAYICQVWSDSRPHVTKFRSDFTGSHAISISIYLGHEIKLMKPQPPIHHEQRKSWCFLGLDKSSSAGAVEGQELFIDH